MTQNLSMMSSKLNKPQFKRMLHNNIPTSCEPFSSHAQNYELAAQGTAPVSLIPSKIFLRCSFRTQSGERQGSKLKVPRAPKEGSIKSRVVLKALSGVSDGSGRIL